MRHTASMSILSTYIYVGVYIYICIYILRDLNFVPTVPADGLALQILVYSDHHIEHWAYFKVDILRCIFLTEN